MVDSPDTKADATKSSAAETIFFKKTQMITLEQPQRLGKPLD